MHLNEVIASFPSPDSSKLWCFFVWQVIKSSYWFSGDHVSHGTLFYCPKQSQYSDIVHPNRKERYCWAVGYGNVLNGTLNQNLITCWNGIFETVIEQKQNILADGMFFFNCFPCTIKSANVLTHCFFLIGLKVNLIALLRSQFDTLNNKQQKSRLFKATVGFNFHSWEMTL